jgi:hypothetical protein
MVDLAISIAGTGIYEAMRAIAISALTERRQVRIYSKTELAEQAQRLLASRLSLPFGKLTLKRIEISDGQKAVADFIADRQRYRVSIQMMGGVGVITRLQYEFEVRL